MNDYDKAIERMKNLLEMRGAAIPIYKESLNEIKTLIYSLLGIIAIFAGFGFSAFEHIKNYGLFFAGEFLVMASIGNTLYGLKDNALKNMLYTENFINDNISETNKVKKSIIRNDPDDIRSIANAQDKEVYSTELQPRMRLTRMLRKNLNVSLFYAVIGLSLIFLSFFSLPLSVICWKS